jgi:hypothetical protein
MSMSSEFRGAGHALFLAGFTSATERLQVAAMKESLERLREVALARG